MPPSSLENTQVQAAHSLLLLPPLERAGWSNQPEKFCHSPTALRAREGRPRPDPEAPLAQSPRPAAPGSSMRRRAGRSASSWTTGPPPAAPQPPHPTTPHGALSRAPNDALALIGSSPRDHAENSVSSPPPLDDWFDRWAVLGSHWHSPGARPLLTNFRPSAGAEAANGCGWPSAPCPAPMADQEAFVAQQQPLADGDNGMLNGAEEDPAAAFLAQQEDDLADIENDPALLDDLEVFAEVENGGDLGLGMRGGRPGQAPRRRLSPWRGEARCPAGGAGRKGIPAWRGFSASLLPRRACVRDEAVPLGPSPQLSSPSTCHR